MIPTIPSIEGMFDRFNAQMFEGRLPKITVQLSDAKSFIGMCTYKKRHHPFGRVEYYDFRLRINRRIDLTETELEDTVIHEMIHYHIALNHLRDTSAHGTTFRSLMDDINRKYGRHVTISHHPTKEQKEQLQDTRHRWHIIAVVHFNDGRTGIKVLPHTTNKAIRYYSRIIRADKVTSIQLYETDTPYFNRYPCSAALNVIFADQSDVMENLTEAQPLAIKGNRLIASTTP